MYFDWLAEGCKLYLESEGICGDPQRAEFDLEVFSKGVCGWMVSWSFKRPPSTSSSPLLNQYLSSVNDVSAEVGDRQYHNMMTHFPHKFLTTYRVRFNHFTHPPSLTDNQKSSPVSLVCVFVSLVRRMGLRAAPVGFPGNVHAWIALPSTSITNDVGLMEWEQTTPARELRVDVFHADGEIFLDAANLRQVLAQTRVPEGDYAEKMRPSPAKEMVLRAVDDIFYSATYVLSLTRNLLGGVDLLGDRRMYDFEDRTITPESRAAALYTASVALLLGRPDVFEFIRYTTNITTAINSRFPLDATPILSYLTTHAFPTGYVHTSLSDAAKQIKDNEGPGPAKDRKKEGVQCWVGMMFRHKQYGYVGLVLAWDGECKAREGLNVDDLSRGRRQPFYSVLTYDGELMCESFSSMLAFNVDQEGRCGGR